MNTEELIHKGFLAWDEENDALELTDEQLFEAGARFIINYLIQQGKL